VPKEAAVWQKSYHGKPKPLTKVHFAQRFGFPFLALDLWGSAAWFPLTLSAGADSISRHTPCDLLILQASAIKKTANALSSESYLLNIHSDLKVLLLYPFAVLPCGGGAGGGRPCTPSTPDWASVPLLCGILVQPNSLRATRPRPLWRWHCLLGWSVVPFFTMGSLQKSLNDRCSNANPSQLARPPRHPPPLFRQVSVLTTQCYFLGQYTPAFSVVGACRRWRQSTSPWLACRRKRASGY
jgi:hypothetical protein